MEVDLVCRAEVSGDNPKYFSEYNLRKYVFCSPECKRRFDDHPDYFIHTAAKERLGLD